MEYVVIWLFIAFFVKHFVVDFIQQTQKMVDEKGNYGSMWGLAHSLDHGFWTAIILAMYYVMFPHTVPFTMIMMIVGLASVDTLIHYHVDYAKMNLNKNLTIYDKKYWVLLGFDQLLHYLTYAGIIAILMWV